MYIYIKTYIPHFIGCKNSFDGGMQHYDIHIDERQNPKLLTARKEKRLPGRAV